MSRLHTRTTGIPASIPEEAPGATGLAVRTDNSDPMSDYAYLSINCVPPTPIYSDGHAHQNFLQSHLTRSPSIRSGSYDDYFAVVGSSELGCDTDVRIGLPEYTPGVPGDASTASPDAPEITKLHEVGPSNKTCDPDREAAKAWSNCAREMMQYDEDNVTRWKEEIDTLLVFAGLFSAVVTAFLVESCKSLHAEPTERVVAVLELIVAELRNTTVESSVGGSEAETRFVPTHLAPLVAALWFTSLIFSLTVAFVGLLVKQWLGEYTAGLMTISRSRVSRKHAHARQHRHNALRKWRVETIMATLPVILQVALIFFLVGLTELFMAFNPQVGIVALSFLVALLAFSLLTSVLPVFSVDCSYRSPQAFALYFLSQLALYTFRAALRLAQFYLSRLTGTPSATTTQFEEVKVVCVHSPGSHATSRTPSHVQCLITWLKEHGGRRVHWSWKDREEAKLLACHSGYEPAMLDELDRVKMDLEILKNTVRPCLRTLNPDDALECVRHILIRRADAVLFDLPSWTRNLDRETLLLLCDILLDLLTPPGPTSGPVGNSDARPNEDEWQWQLLQMLHRLMTAGDHFTLLDGQYDRIFMVLMAYRRQCSTTVPDENRRLIYGMLFMMTGENPPSTSVVPQDFPDVIAYGRQLARRDFCDGALLWTCTLAVMVLQALNGGQREGANTDPDTAPQLDEVLALFHCMLDEVILPRFSSRSEHLTDREEYFAVINDFFRTFEAYFRSNNRPVSVLRSWNAVREAVDRLDEQCGGSVYSYRDASGRTTKEIMNNIKFHWTADVRSVCRRHTSDSFKRVAHAPAIPLKKAVSEPQLKPAAGVLDTLIPFRHRGSKHHWSPV